MAIAPANTNRRLAVRPFDNRHADLVVSWVASVAELRWLAPSTHWPLTVDKVRAWRREHGQAFGLHIHGNVEPIGYGELNPMRSDPSLLWLGHVVLSPRYRRYGLGGRFVDELSRVAFENRATDRLVLVAFPANTAALQCYKRVGFRAVGEEFHLIGNLSTGRRQHRLVRLELTREDRGQ